MKKHSKKHTPVKTVFIQSFGMYQDELLVSFGKSTKEIIAYLKRVGANKNAIEWLEQENATLPLTKNFGYLTYEENSGLVALVCREFTGSWNEMMTILHEVHHAVEVLAKRKHFMDEMENKAYLFEYLFTSIWNKMVKLYEKQG